MPQFEHPTLGQITHLSGDQVLAFRGLKYASLKHAFAAPEICSTKSSSVVDGTSHGPTAVSPAGGCDMEMQLIQKSLPHDQFKYSATECLNLNVCVPEGANGPLPVFLFFHGGGFRIGSNAWPQYDLQKFVKLSRQIGRPVIGVQANYRLGVYGFLHSQALSETGIPSNRGLRDQRAAMEWIHQHIAGFGGDPQQLTVIGESAGGVSCTLHLQSNKPLFSQLVSMGGTALLMKPLPPFVADFAYKSVLQKLDIDGSLTSREQLDKLMSISTEDILAKVTPDVPLFPIIDGDVITSPAEFSPFESPSKLPKSWPGVEWCKRVMLGDCQFDGGILGYALLPRQQGIYSTFVQCLKTHLSEKSEDIDAIFESYSITSDHNNEVTMEKILEFITDVQFYAPTIVMAQAWPQSSFVYHFNEPNPWDGPLKGKASHILDVAFLFQNYNQELSAEQQKTAKRFAEDIIKFFSGEAPFPPRATRMTGAQVYGPPGKSDAVFVSSEDPSEYGRSSRVWKLAARFGWDKLSTTLDMLITGH